MQTVHHQANNIAPDNDGEAHDRFALYNDRSDDDDSAQSDEDDGGDDDDDDRVDARAAQPRHHISNVILSWADFSRRVRRHIGIRFQLTDDKLQRAALFLNDIGEIIFDPHSPLGNIVIANPRWVCAEFFGWLFAPEFMLTAHKRDVWSQLQRLAALGPVPIAVVDHLGCFSLFGLDIGLSLLAYFEVAHQVTVDGGECLLFPSLLRITDHCDQQLSHIRLRFQPIDPGDIIMPGVFPHVQVRALRMFSLQTTVWQGGLRLINEPISVTVRLSERDRFIEIAVNVWSEKSSELVPVFSGMVLSAFRKMSPGARVELTVLEDTPEDVHWEDYTGANAMTHLASGSDSALPGPVLRALYEIQSMHVL